MLLEQNLKGVRHFETFIAWLLASFSKTCRVGGGGWFFLCHFSFSMNEYQIFLRILMGNCINEEPNGDV